MSGEPEENSETYYNLCLNAQRVADGEIDLYTLFGKKQPMLDFHHVAQGLFNPEPREVIRFSVSHLMQTVAIKLLVACGFGEDAARRELAQDTYTICEHSMLERECVSLAVILSLCKYAAKVRGDMQTRIAVAAFIGHCRLNEDVEGVKEFKAVLNDMPQTPVKEPPSREDLQEFRKTIFRYITGTSLDF